VKAEEEGKVFFNPKDMGVDNAGNLDEEKIGIIYNILKTSNNDINRFKGSSSPIRGDLPSALKKNSRCFFSRLLAGYQMF
jgi:hypothetical protein